MQFALHRFERVVNYFPERFVSAVVHLLFIRDQLVPGSHGDIDAAPIWISFLVSVIGLLDRHVAAVDMIAESLEAGCIIQNEIVDLVRLFQTTVRDLNRQLHNYLRYYGAGRPSENKNFDAASHFKSVATSGND